MQELFGGNTRGPPPAAPPTGGAGTAAKGLKNVLGAGASVLSQGVRMAARRSEDPRAQYLRQKLLLEELESKPEKTNANRKRIINMKVFMEKLKLRMQGRFANNNNNQPGLLSQFRRQSLRPTVNFTRSEGIWQAHKQQLSRNEFIRGMFKIRNVRNPAERLSLLRDLEQFGPKNRAFRQQIASYISNAERERNKRPNNRNRNRGGGGGTTRGSGSGGQQIIMGPQAGPGPAGPAGPAGMPGPAAPVAWGGGGALPPQISVKVSSPKINLGRNTGARMNMGGGTPAQQRMNEASLVKNAGGPEAVRAAVTALKRANGNVNVAANSSGLPRQTFNVVKKLGGVNAAPRIVAAVIRRKRTTVHKKPHKKRAVTRRAPVVRTNRLKKVVHKVPRKNLEKFVLLWALRKKK